MDWLETGIGNGLLQEELRQVRDALDSIFGDQFLQLGGWGGERFREYARTRRATLVRESDSGAADMRSSLENLGIVNDSIDVVLLPHVLESHRDPHGVLREVDRVLRSDGHVVILGFNPASLWGIRHAVSRRAFPPGIRRMISERRLRDWLRLLSFAVDHSSFRYYHAPMLYPGRRTRRTRPHGGMPDVAGDSGYPRSRVLRAVKSSVSAGIGAWRRYAPFAGCYLLVARKHMITLTPVRPVWKPRARLVGGLVNPTTRIKI